MENTHFNPLFEVGVITLTVCEFRRTCDEDQLKLVQMCVRRRRVHKKKKPVSDQFISLNITLTIIIQNEKLAPCQCWWVP